MEVGQLYCNSITFDWCETVSSVSLGAVPKSGSVPGLCDFKLIQTSVIHPGNLIVAPMCCRAKSSSFAMFAKFEIGKIIKQCELLKAVHEKCPGCSRNDGRSPSNIGGLCKSNHETSGKQSGKPENSEITGWLLQMPSMTFFFAQRQGLIHWFSRWWFEIFIFIPTWGRFPIWLLFFKWVETTN